MWKPTELGIKFVKNEINLPKHIFLYNNKFLKFSDEKINVIEALGDKFNYDELMNS
jgi:hypothetical protein